MLQSSRRGETKLTCGYSTFAQIIPKWFCPGLLMQLYLPEDRLAFNLIRSLCSIQLLHRPVSPLFDMERYTNHGHGRNKNFSVHLNKTRESVV